MTDRAGLRPERRDGRAVPGRARAARRRRRGRGRGARRRRLRDGGRRPCAGRRASSSSRRCRGSGSRTTGARSSSAPRSRPRRCGSATAHAGPRPGGARPAIPASHVVVMELLPDDARNWQAEIALGRTYVEAGDWAGETLGALALAHGRRPGGRGRVRRPRAVRAAAPEPVLRGRRRAAARGGAARRCRGSRSCASAAASSTATTR